MSFFRDRLEAFPRLADYRLAKASGYWPYYKTVESASRPRFTIEGQDYINFGSNNYLSLSYHPRVIEAAQAATASYGTGVTGSRLLNGTLDLHRTLEAELAEFYGREAALVFSTGYVANISTIAGLLNRHDYAVLDKDAHNSLAHRRPALGRDDEAVRPQRPRPARQDPRTSSRPSRARPSSSTASTRWVATPRRSTAMVELCRAHPNTFLLDDEAHGLGVLGERGRGAAEHYGVLDDVDLLTITFSKTLGSCGGAVIGSADAIELLTLDADPLIFTASNTPGSIAAALEGVRILRDAPELTGAAPRRTSTVLRRPAHRARRPGEPGRERDHHDPAAPARRGVGGRARPRAARGRRVREPGRRARRAAGLGLIRLSLMLDHTPALLEEAAEVMLKVLNDNDQLPD